jgi:hypothetical protein
METLAHFLLDSARGRMLLLTACGFPVWSAFVPPAVRVHHPRLARVLLVLGCVVVIAIVFDPFGLFDVFVRR